MKHVKLLSVPVADQERAKKFYVDQLGTTLLADQRWGDEQRWIQVGLPHAETSLTLVTWFDDMPPGSLRGLVIETDDSTGTCASSESAGCHSSANRTTNRLADSRHSPTRTATG